MLGELVVELVILHACVLKRTKFKLLKYFSNCSTNTKGKYLHIQLEQLHINQFSLFKRGHGVLRPFSAPAAVRLEAGGESDAAWFMKELGTEEENN